MTAQSIEDLVKTESKGLCQKLKKASDWATSEEDLRIETEKALNDFKSKAGLQDKLMGRHEVTIGKGRADSVYNYVVIEYKKPDSFKEHNTAPKNREVIEQLKKRFKHLEKSEERNLKKLYGIGFDGCKFIFIRYRNGKWNISKPLSVTKQTTEHFLRALLALAASGRAFQSHYLVEDFGAEAPISKTGIQTFYQAIKNTSNPKANVLFNEWKILFGEVGGYDVRSLKRKIRDLANFYEIQGKPDPSMLIFAVHTYYSLFMKLLAAEIMNYFNPMVPSVLSTLKNSATPSKFKDTLEKIEGGGIYKQMGITNFLEGDLFSWYLDVWKIRGNSRRNGNIERVTQDMTDRLNDYDPLTLAVEPSESRDLLKELYQNLFPRKLRHDLGEYYTPDWLAEWVLEKLDFKGDPDKRILDPACGSGTFLVLAIQKIRQYALEKMIPEKELLTKITTNVIGFDLNPLAVMAARLNYIITIKDLIKYGAELEIPIYLCDSIMTPSEYGKLFTPNGTPSNELRTTKKLSTSVGKFFLPTEIASTRENLARYTETLEQCIDKDYNSEEFMGRLKEAALPVTNKDLHIELFTQLAELNKERKNKIWARIIKNSFAPLFIDAVDYIVGNPPWVNWEHLPDNYREELKPLYEEKYNLFPHKGFSSRHGSTRIDISTLMTYVALDKYTKPSGKLGFVITQSVFGTDAGKGFRRFELPDGTKLRVVRTDDMVDIEPFKGASSKGPSNKTSTIILQKKARTNYPVPYHTWIREPRKRIPSNADLKEALDLVNIIDEKAIPADKSDEQSIWLAGKAKALESIQNVLGKSDYKAHEGVNSGGANAVYWIKIHNILENDLVRIKNMPHTSKKDISEVEMIIEEDLVYPLVRENDVNRWCTLPSSKIINPQDPTDWKNALPESTMKTKYPKAFSYFHRFKTVLENRSAYKKYLSDQPFYALYDIKDYTFTPWKVIWSRFRSPLRTAVISTREKKPILPQETISLISSNDEKEAHYICALMNSSPFNCAAICSPQVGGKSFGKPGIVKLLRIPKYDPSNDNHQQLANLSIRTHEIADGEYDNQLKTLEEKIDKFACAVWEIGKSKLIQIKKTLRDKC